MLTIGTFQIKNIINSLEESGIDIIECGCLDNKKGKDSDSTIFNSVETTEKILSIFTKKFILR